MTSSKPCPGPGLTHRTTQTKPGSVILPQGVRPSGPLTPRRVDGVDTSRHTFGPNPGTPGCTPLALPGCVLRRCHTVCHRSDWCTVPQRFAVVSDWLVPDVPRTPVALSRRVLLLALGTWEARRWLQPQLWPGTSPLPLWKANTLRCLSSHQVWGQKTHCIHFFRDNE